MKELKIITDFVGDNSYKEIDYNLLMRAVDKIESFEGGPHNTAKYNVRIEQCFIDIIENHTSGDIVVVDGETKQRALQKAILKFIEHINSTVVEFGPAAGVVGYIKYTDEGKYYSVNRYSLESASPDFDSTDFLADYFKDKGKLVVIEPDANDWR